MILLESLYRKSFLFLIHSPLIFFQNFSRNILKSSFRDLSRSSFRDFSTSSSKDFFEIFTFFFIFFFYFSPVFLNNFNPTFLSMFYLKFSQRFRRNFQWDFWRIPRWTAGEVGFSWSFKRVPKGFPRESVECIERSRSFQKNCRGYLRRFLTFHGVLGGFQGSSYGFQEKFQDFPKIAP